MNNEVKEFYKAVTDDMRGLLKRCGSVQSMVFFLGDDNITCIPVICDEEDDRHTFYKFLKDVVLPEIDGLQSVVIASEACIRETNSGDPDKSVVAGEKGAINALVFNYYSFGDQPKLKAYEIIRDEQGKVMETRLKFSEENLDRDTILSDYFNPITRH